MEVTWNYASDLTNKKNSRSEAASGSGRARADSGRHAEIDVTRYCIKSIRHAAILLSDKFDGLAST